MKKKNTTREALIDINVNWDTGLTKEQLADRQSKGYVNDVKIGSSKSYVSIIFGNIFTFFNLLCLAIFVWLITVIDDGSGVKNLTFMVIILLNVAIGIIQEVKAKKTMDKLSLLSSPNVHVLRDGESVEVRINEIVKNDIMSLGTGCQVCSDAVVRSGEVEVNESLLTGESMPIKKTTGDTLMSGSFIVSGKCKAEVTSVAEENYIQKLAMDAKAFKRPKSELMRSIRLIMRVIGLVVIPIGILSFLTNWNAELRLVTDFGNGLFSSISNLSVYTSGQLFAAYKAAVTPTSTALIGVIPAGLVLLISVALSVGVIRLATQHAHVQELYSIETLARVDMLCLDKTGTITDGTMKVRECVATGTRSMEEVSAIVSSMQYALDDENLTSLALIGHFGKVETHKQSFIIPFSSGRKCSAVKFDDNNMYVLGAPEFVTNCLSDKSAALIDEYSRQGNRCLLLACHEGHGEDKAIPADSKEVAVIVIQDNIKEDAVQTIAYFKENGVDVRVISGDNPVTVSEVARRVGIPNADKYLNLYGVGDTELVEKCLDYTVFGRVSPEQKKLLVATFKKAGHTVAMTGDGINDILALKEADCSIAMANGSEATRNVAQLVLMDSNFASMPKVVAEGRRVVNNIERASTLFLTKTVFSVLLQLILVFMGQSLPLEPIQLSFISFFCIGVPSFFLALEPNNRKIEGRFLTNVARRVVPASIAVVLNVVLIMVLCVSTNVIAIPSDMISTAVMICIYVVFMQVLYNICKQFNPRRFIMFAVITLWSLLCIFFMPYAGGGIVNLFSIVHVNDINAIMMIFSLMLLSQFVLQITSTIARKLKIENKRLKFDYDFRAFFKGITK